MNKVNGTVTWKSEIIENNGYVKMRVEITEKTVDQNGKTKQYGIIGDLSGEYAMKFDNEISIGDRVDMTYTNTISKYNDKVTGEERRFQNINLYSRAKIEKVLPKVVDDQWNP